MDKTNATNQSVNHVQTASENLNISSSRLSSGSSSPNNQIPLFSVNHSPPNDNLYTDSKVTCSKCSNMDYCNCEQPPRNRQKACSLTLESENTFANYANNQLKNTFPYHEAKRSLSVSVPSKKKLSTDKQNNNSKYGEHLNLINVNITEPNNQCLKTSLQTPSIHISENPLSNTLINNCTCLNHNNTAKLIQQQNEKQYLCLLHQDHLTHQIYNSQNQFITTSTANGHLAQLNQFNQLNQQLNQTAHHLNQLCQQRNSIHNIPLNLVNSPSKTPSKESIYQQSEFNSAHTCLPPIESPSVISMGKCESIAHSLILSQQQQQQSNNNQTLKRPSFAQLSPQNAISNSSTSNNLMANARQDRLFSVGPSFHIQFKHPSQFGWKDRSNLEKRLIVSLASSSIFFIFLITGSHLFRTYLNSRNEVCMSDECVKTAATLLNAMDLTANPCEDFFSYACGNWNKQHIISDDRSSISTFEVMADNLQVILKSLLEEPVSSTSDNSATIKAKTFYKSCMKIEKIEEIHDQPLKDLVQNLGGWPVINENWIPLNWKKEELLARLRAELNQGTILEMWIGPDDKNIKGNKICDMRSKKGFYSNKESAARIFFDTIHFFFRLLDDKNSTAHIIQVDQMAFGLPSREYYLKPSSKKERDAYLKLMVELAVLLGAKRDYAAKEMRKVLDFEIKLANVSMTEADRHDTGSIYKKLTVKELQNIVKEFDWLLYFNKILPEKIDVNEQIVIYSLSYLIETGKILEQTEVKVIHNYIIWRLVRNLTPYLAGEYIQKRIDFRKVLLGVSAERIRWNQCVEMVNKRLGIAVGALFIKQHFDPNAKKTALEMIQNIRRAFNELLDENEWMDSQTKLVAKKKANEMNERIGYPAFLTNPMELSNEFTQLQVYEDQFLLNILNLLKFEATKNLAKLRKPVDKEKWTTEPAVVNAF